MLKAILGVILGYILMTVIVFGCFTAAWFILGADGSFKPGVWDASTTWLIMSFVVGFVAAAVGGMVCAAVAGKGSTAPMVFAGVVLVLGYVMAIPAMGKERNTGPRPAEITMTEAMTGSQQPTIAYLLNPLIGAVGVAAGASLRRR